MKVAYVDTSCLVSIAFGEGTAKEMRERVERYDELYSANLLEAEFRCTLARERAAGDADLLEGLSWVLPRRPLSPEITTVLSHGYLRGADLWHLACALYLAGEAGEMEFLTLDDRQAEVAQSIGFGGRD